MSITRIQYQSNVSVTEVLEGSDLNTATIARSGFNTTKELTPTSTPAVSMYAAGTLVLSGGDDTLDLTAVPNSPLAAVNFNGARIRIAKFKAPNTNLSLINIQDGAANGYDLMGATWSISLSPGQEITFYAESDAPLVSSTSKNIDITNSGSGSNADELEYSFAGG